MDLTTPQGRLAAAEALGPDGYNKAMQAHIDNTTLEVVAGHRIRRIDGTRFGTLYQVGIIKAFATIEQAREFATENPAEAEKDKANDDNH